VTSPKIKYFGNLIFWEIISVFGKFEFGKILPFMAIPNFEFVNCNKLL
jgi:hypothetical protein